MSLLVVLYTSKRRVPHSISPCRLSGVLYSLRTERVLLETEKRLRFTPAKALKDSVLGLTGAATKAKPARVKAVKKKPTDSPATNQEDRLAAAVRRCST
jgi:hypothetical protein